MAGRETWGDGDEGRGRGEGKGADLHPLGLLLPHPLPHVGKGWYQRQLEAERGAASAALAVHRRAGEGAGTGFLVEYYVLRGLERRLDFGGMGQDGVGMEEGLACPFVAFTCRVTGTSFEGKL